MRVKSLALTSFWTALCCLSSLVLANISVSPLEINLLTNKLGLNTTKITIKNTNNKSIFVHIIPFAIKNPGEKPIIKKRLKPAELGLLVSPRQMVLAPLEQKKVRVSYIASGSLKHDLLFTIQITPQNGTPYMKKKDNLETGVSIQIGYETLLIVRPIKMNRLIEIKRIKKKGVCRNLGNTTTDLINGKQCLQKECHNLPSLRLYSGQIKEIKLPFEAPFSYQIIVMDKKARNLKSN